MWNFILGFLFARATGISRFVRPLLLLVLIGAVIVGFIYAAAIFKAANQRSDRDHVQHHSTH
jgi:general stress protein CsbA